VIQSFARGLACALLQRIESGQLTLVEDGRRTVFGSGSPQATVVVRDPRLWTALRRGGKGFAEAYVDGWWDSPDVTAVIEVAARNLHPIDELRRRITPVREPWQRARALLERNTPLRSREDIAAHYDLGNDLFGLMLDDTMMYSSAIFDRRDMPLEEASRAKLDRICDKLDLQPSDHVLEIGTGWGGFALHAASTRGCRVTTTTLSKEQRELALERVRAAGLEDRVTILLDDYRELTGTYDKLVSIEMIEAVGWKDFGTFFERCASMLRPDGVMALQAITIDDRLYDVEKAQRSFMNSLIFPNGCLPSVEVIARNVARHGDLRMVDLEDITPHYAETLRRWRANVEAHAARLAELGYDERFQRLWTLYLSFCEAGFTERRIGNVQVVLAKPRWRGHLATAEAPATPSVVTAAHA
jgi:cyclopropane-fatty-acyl-phospholipid synthase